LIERLFPEQADRRTASFAATLCPFLGTLEPMDRFLILQNLIESVTSDFADFERRLADALAGERGAPVQKQMRDVLTNIKTPIFASALSADGTRLQGTAVKVLENDQPWEAHIVEGTWVQKHDGRYFMLYAGNDFSTAEYGISVAVSDSSLGPFYKSPAPFLCTTAEWFGPGHPSVAKGPDGKLVMFFHAFYPGEQGYKKFRALLAMPLDLGEIWERNSARDASATDI
jgi:hypothetical protein